MNTAIQFFFLIIMGDRKVEVVADITWLVSGW